MYAEERQQAIVELALESGRVSVTHLAQRFDVTPETIRRDLDTLTSLGLISRVHGGAVPAERVRLVESGFSDRETSHLAEKRRIAAAALTYLPSGPGSTVCLDAGTTVAKLADLIPTGQVDTIITNCLPTASAVSMRHPAEVHLVGGLVRGITQAAVGSVTVDTLRALRVDVAFLGANGFTAEHGFSTPDFSEGAVKRAMVGSASRIVLLADSSKFGREYLVSFVAASDVDVLITDTALPTSAKEALTELGIEVVCA